MLKSKKLMLALTIAASMTSTTVFAKTTPANESNKSPNNIIESQKEDKTQDKKEKFEKREEKINKRLEEQSKLVEKADKIAPGIKVQWDKVITERKELMEQFKPLMQKHREENKAKDNNVENKKEYNEEGKEKHEKMREEKKAMWKDFEKAVDSKDAKKVKSSFDKIIKSMQESNSRLKSKIEKLS